MRPLPSLLVLVLFLHRVYFMGALNHLQTQTSEENKSVFDIIESKVFFVVSIVVLLAVEVVSGILFWAKQSDMKASYYKVLKFIDIALAMLDPFLLMMAIDHYHKYEWIGMLLFDAIMAIAVGYVGYGDDSLNTSSLAAGITFLGLLLEPLLLVLVLLGPSNLDSVARSVLYLYVAMEIMNVVMMVFNFIAQEIEAIQQLHYKNDMEAHQMIQQDKNKSDMKAQQVILE